MSRAPFSDFVSHLLDQLTQLGDVRAKRMFGGYGLYCDGWFFALVADDVLYLKADAHSRAAFEAAGLQPFQPFADKPTTMSYYPPPAEAMDDIGLLLAWAQKGVEAARRKPAKSPRTKRSG